MEAEAGPLPEEDREALCERVVLLARGLGPLEPLLSDPRWTRSWSTARNRCTSSGAAGSADRGGFAGEPELLHAIERILSPLGRRVDEASPLCDARLPDGSRVHAVIPPLSLTGPCLTIRRFRREGFWLRDLVARSTLAPELAEFLALCVAAKAGSMLVSGGTGAGKTTTLNALSGAIPGEERIVTIEDAAELRLRQRTWCAWRRGRRTSRPRRGDDPDAGPNALRMRPDRIVVGEVRGAKRSTCCRRSTPATTAR